METFYSVLGVGPDADRQAVVRAYRDKAKSHHPDVCDRPDATERFKRLTTAKEVLTDETKRSEYDRLGHESYVRRHGDCSGWTVESAIDDRAATVSSSTAGPAASPASRAARAYVDHRDSSSEATPKQDPTRGGSGGTAAAYYRAGERMDPGNADSATGSAFSRFQAVGPWLVLDGILLLSALATAWVILTWGALSALSIVLAAVLCVAALAATSVHLSTRAYA